MDDKTQALDEEKHLRQGVEEEYAKMQKTWDQITQGENPAEEQLAEECEELRVSQVIILPTHLVKSSIPLLGPVEMQCLSYEL